MREAGGRVSDTDGSDYGMCTRGVLATNGHVHEEVQQILKDADAMRAETL